MNPNVVDCENNTPLHLVFSIFSKDKNAAILIADCLLKSGCDVINYKNIKYII